MKQKMIMIVLGGCLCTLSAVAQSLSGKIQDKEKASLAYVTVSAKSQSDTTQIYGGISDDNGKYRIQLPMGNYKVEYRFLGYKSQEQVVSISLTLMVLLLKITMQDCLQRLLKTLY